MDGVNREDIFSGLELTSALLDSVKLIQKAPYIGDLLDLRRRSDCVNAANGLAALFKNTLAAVLACARPLERANEGKTVTHGDISEVTAAQVVLKLALRELKVLLAVRNSPSPIELEDFSIIAEAMQTFEQQSEGQWNELSAKVIREALDAAAYLQKTEAARTSPSKRRVTKAEYNVLLRDYLEKYPDATARDAQQGIKCKSSRMLCSLAAWKVVSAARKQGRKPKSAPKAVSLTESMAAIAQKNNTMAILIREQHRDDRTQRVWSRERL